MSIPVITIDGPSGSGKGTIAGRIAKHLSFHYLDSGAIYRALSWVILANEVDLNKKQAIYELLNTFHLKLRIKLIDFVPKIEYDNQDISSVIREERVSCMASKIAALPFIREHLLKLQRMMRRLPGLIAEGRDMGSVIFPDASMKFYLDATEEVRAQRRYDQLKARGRSVSLRDIRLALSERDYRDQHRQVSPMKPLSDMIYIDTSSLDINKVFHLIVEKLRK